MAIGEGLAHLVLVLQVEADAAAVVAVERLDDDRVADPLGRRATAWSAVRTDSCLGTGRPAAPSSRVVRSLSEAMSTAIEVVSEVMVARIRLAWTPWPSWTRECWLSRIHGMSRETASSRIAWVEGPNAVRSARRMNASSSALPVELRVGLDEVVDQAYGEPGGGEPDLLVDVPEDHVVVARAGP